MTSISLLLALRVLNRLGKFLPSFPLRVFMAKKGKPKSVLNISKTEKGNKVRSVFLNRLNPTNMAAVTLCTNISNS